MIRLENDVACDPTAAAAGSRLDYQLVILASYCGHLEVL